MRAPDEFSLRPTACFPWMARSLSWMRSVIWLIHTVQWCITTIATPPASWAIRAAVFMSICGVMDRVDIITGTFGKALGGGSGGFTAGRQEIIDILRQRSRPYLFSNTLAPAICAASLKVLDMLEASTVLRDTLHENTRYFREQMQANGFAIPEGDHPIVPVMLGDAVVAQKMSERLLALGIYAIGFFYPVVPQGKARIRVQISAGHTKDDLDKAVAAFATAHGEIAA